MLPFMVSFNFETEQINVLIECINGLIYTDVIPLLQEGLQTQTK